MRRKGTKVSLAKAPNNPRRQQPPAIKKSDQVSAIMKHASPASIIPRVEIHDREVEAVKTGGQQRRGGAEPRCKAQLTSRQAVVRKNRISNQQSQRWLSLAEKLFADLIKRRAR